MEDRRVRALAAVFILALVCGASSGIPAGAQGAPPPGLQQAVDRVIQAEMAKSGAPGFAVGVSLHGQEYFFGYGRADDNQTPFRADTVVEVGSCTKVFTATLLALAVQAGKMSLNDPIQKYMPAGVALTPNTRRVTLLELATMSSGMPRVPSDFPNALEDEAIDHYTTQDFFAFVSAWNAPDSLPAPYLYSNAGFGLLGYLIANATGTPWEQAVAADVTGPLGMQDTEMHPSDAQRARLAEGYRANGQRAPEWPVFAYYAAGALRSTVHDMLLFGEANLGHTTVGGAAVPPVLTSAMALAQQSHYHVAKPGFEQALGWEVFPDGAVLKDGGTAGFGSVLVLNKAKDLAVFAVANTPRAAIDNVGLALARDIH